MVELFEQKRIGAVGAKLLYEDSTLQHAGVILGINGSAGHYCKGKSDGFHYFNMGVIKNVSACTAACLLVKKEIYESVGGLDEKDFKIAYNDIDLCLKIQKIGFRIAYTPYAKLYHYESKSRGYEDTLAKQKRHDQEKRILNKKWGKSLKLDFYHNPNFSIKTEELVLKIY